ncbi:hypothetical protein HYDPIDRAFT_107273 [Hydnomerulius pinastri MD-312]|nr:hypothetical protein HYDPIDRAFT_107273 [Hydnomerulius pinastri MD-312]
MKRGAERQLTKDGPDDDDDDIEEIEDPGQGFRKADETVLAKRQIRGLPKRVMAGTATTTKAASFNGFASTPAPPPAEADKETAGPPKFGGFGGFGAPAAVSNPFTFTAQPPPAPPVSVFGSSGFDTGSKPAQQPQQLFKAAVMPIAPGAVNLFPSGSDVSPPKAATSEAGDATALTYYKSLRGLNVSFLSAISTAVEKDPFFDVASLAESYKNLRTTIQSEFDSSSQPPKSTNPPPASSSIFGSKPPASDKPVPQFSMPKPPASFTGFGASVVAPPKAASTSESSTKTGGFSFPAFTPPPSSSAPTAQLPFSLIPKPSEPPSSSSSTPAPEPPKSAFALGGSKTDDSSTPKSGFSFATPPSTATATTKSLFGSSTQDADSSSSTTAAPSSQPAPTTSLFGSSTSFFANSKATTNAFGATDSSKPTSAFGTSIFGSGSTSGESSKPSPFFTSASDPFKTGDNKDTSKATTSLFGSTTTPATTSSASSVFGSSDKPASVFGSTSSPPKPSLFGFGKPGGSIGNPVGFGFGAPSPKAGDSGAASGSSSSAFSFGAPPPEPADNPFSPPTTENPSTESTPQPDGKEENGSGENEGPKLLSTSTHDGDGEGEEDEETMYVVRCKVFRLFKTDDKTEWKDLGVGMLKLKKHKETNVRRILMRNSSTGRILINFRVYASLKPNLAKTSVAFLGHDNGTLTSYRIRVKTEEQAVELKEAMDREIAAFQATT